MEDGLIARDFEQFSAQLTNRGWSVLPREAIDENPAVTLNRIGKIVPQYNGRETFEVKYQPGYDDAPYSQSMNGLGAHTEAPGFEPPPKYLALFCHRQARCGKGQTLLADGIRFYDKVLSEDLRRWASSNEIEFVAAASPSSKERNSFRAPIRAAHDGQSLLRFSYNLFRYGNVNPSGEDVKRAEAKELDSLGKIAEEGEAYFADNLIPVLIPDRCMLVWNNHRLMHGRGEYSDPARHLTRYWLG